MNKIELEKLVERIMEGDEGAFEEFYNATYRGLYSFIYSRTKNHHTTEDILEDTYAKFRANIHKYKRGTNIIAWICQIGKNISIDYFRKVNREGEEELLDNYEYPQNDTNIDDKLYVHQLLNRCLNQEDREIVIKHILWGYTFREIAEDLKKPIGTIVWKYNEALKILKKEVEEDVK